MKRFKSIIALLCCFLLLTGFAPMPSDRIVHLNNQKINNIYQETVEVVIFESDDKIVTAEVPSEFEVFYSSEYSKQALLNSFNKSNIEITNLSLNDDFSLNGYAPGQPVTPSPERRLMSVHYLTRYNIKNYMRNLVDLRTLTDAFDTFPLGSTALAAAVSFALKKAQLAKNTTLVGLGVDIILWGFGRWVDYQGWWIDSISMTMNGHINGVKHEIWENLKSEYPKVFNIYLRY